MIEQPLHKLSAKTADVADALAADLLHGLVMRAAERLAALGRMPVLVAAASNKFNDAGDDDQWYAVQIGETYWEQSQFFVHWPEPKIEERSFMKGEFTRDDLKTGASEVASRQIVSMRQVLADLEKAGWRALAAQVLEGTYDTVVCLAIQHGQPWLCRASPVDGQGDVWLCTPDRGFIHFGRCGRIDRDIGDPDPIGFLQIRQDALTHLTAEARRYFAPEVRDWLAYGRLAKLVNGAASDASSVTDQPLALVSRNSRWTFWGGGGSGWDGRRGQVFWKDTTAPPVEPGAKRRNPRTGAAEGDYPDEIYRLSPILKRLEDAGWRDLFSEAYGVPMIGEQMLALFVGPSYAILVRENSRFLVEDGQIAFAGVGDYPSCIRPDQPP